MINFLPKYAIFIKKNISTKKLNLFGYICYFNSKNDEYELVSNSNNCYSM